MGRRLLAWDAPNVDMGIATLVGGRPTPQQRPDLIALGRWFVDGAEPGEDSEAAVFVNVPEHLVDRMSGWVMWLMQSGYRVFAKPKREGSDIDDDLVAYVRSVPVEELAEVVIASHDARAFLEVGEELAEKGVAVTAIGFRELAGRLATSDLISFVDLGDIDGLFAELPPRMSLVNLPPQGRWFEPLQPLAAAVAGAAGHAPPAPGETD